MMPERGLMWRIGHRVAGLGSLGCERYVAVAEWRGGSVAREAKALAPSVCVWAEVGKGSASIHYEEILESSVRCRDLRIVNPPARCGSEPGQRGD